MRRECLHAERVPDNGFGERELGVCTSSSPAADVMGGGVIEMPSEEVEEGWVKIWQVVGLSKSINGGGSDIRLSVEVKCGP